LPAFGYWLAERTDLVLCADQIVADAGVRFGYPPSPKPRLLVRCATRSHAARSPRTESLRPLGKRFIVFHGDVIRTGWGRPRSVLSHCIGSGAPNQCFDAEQALAAILFLYREVLGCTPGGSQVSCGQSGHNACRWC
jgi:hypothetical protein